MMNNQVNTIPFQINTERLDEFALDPMTKKMKLLSSEDWKAIPVAHKNVWGQRNSRYGFPTVELVEWIKAGIGSRKAVEVAAGQGDLGFHLGIPMSDSCMQSNPVIQLYYKLLNQPVTVPPSDVVKMDAEEAIHTLKPQVVIASWLTQLYQPGDEENKIGSCIGGADEKKIISNCETYIMIGNEKSHGDKRALQLPHRKFKLPFIASRTMYPEDSVVYVWGPLASD